VTPNGTLSGSVCLIASMTNHLGKRLLTHSGDAIQLVYFQNQSGNQWWHCVDSKWPNSIEGLNGVPVLKVDKYPHWDCLFGP
jgi:hypothetical protein